MKRLAKKLQFNRETVRGLGASELSQAGGGMQDRPTKTCYCTITACVTLCISCGNTDCCLMKPGD